MVRPGQELRGHVVCAPYEPPTLHLAYHVVGQLLRNLHQTLLDVYPPLGLPITMASLLPATQYALLNLDLDPLNRQLSNFGDQHRATKDAVLHLFRKPIVEDGLADEIIIRPPSSAGYMERNLADEVQWRGSEARHAVDQISLGGGIVACGVEVDRIVGSNA